MENVILAVFPVESEAYQAMTEFKQVPVGPNAIVSQAALVKKQAGILVTLDAYDTGVDTADDTAMGGLIGSLAGILGGPVGILLGGSLGALAGAGVDAAQADDNASLMEQVASKLPEGAIAIVALAQEDTPAFVDGHLAKFNAMPIRFDAASVAVEVEKARDLQARMERETRARLRQEKKDEFKAKVEEKKAAIKAHFEEAKAKFQR